MCLSLTVLAHSKFANCPLSRIRLGHCYWSSVLVALTPLGTLSSFDMDVKHLQVEELVHFSRYLGGGRVVTPRESARHAISHSEVKSEGSVTEGSRQDFSALELGPDCLLLGIDGGPPLVEGPNGAPPRCGGTNGVPGKRRN